MKREEMTAILDARGVEYTSKTNKADLEALIASSEPKEEATEETDSEPEAEPVPEVKPEENDDTEVNVKFLQSFGSVCGKTFTAGIIYPVSQTLAASLVKSGLAETV